MEKDEAEKRLAVMREADAILSAEIERMAQKFDDWLWGLNLKPEVEMYFRKIYQETAEERRRSYSK